MDGAHIVSSFDEELDKIERYVMEMGGVVEKQIEDAADAVRNRDEELGQSVIDTDKLVDNLEKELDQGVMRILALRQPQAGDLRAVIAVLKVSGNLERIGDYAKNIGKRTRVLTQSPSVGSSATTIKRMATMVRAMVKDVLDAYVTRDTAKAEDVRMRDEDVDQMHNTLFRELLTFMMEDPRNITPCMHLLFIAKNIERMGDHTTSIAEQVIYLVSGEKPEDQRPKGDNTSYVAVEPKE